MRCWGETCVFQGNAEHASTKRTGLLNEHADKSVAQKRTIAACSAVGELVEATEAFEGHRKAHIFHMTSPFAAIT